MFELPITAELVRGALELESTPRGVCPHRLPARARAQAADGQLAMAEAQPSGVRLAFRTSATTIELDALRTRVIRKGAPEPADGGYDLVIDGKLAAQGTVGGGDVLLLDMLTGAAETRRGSLGTVRFTGLPDTPKHVEIWLPYNELVELVALRTDRTAEPAPATGRPVWLHHGSSISHGTGAAGATTTWPALAASHGGVELVNLGFGGSALLDPFTARTMRDAPADLISVKIGINLVNADLLRRRAFGPAVHGFLDTIRDGHPDAPLLVVSPILCPIHEDTPGPGTVDFADGKVLFRATGDPTEVTDTPVGKLTLNVIRAELERIVKQRQAEDPNLHYLDGRALYGESDATRLPLPDNLHPDAEIHRLLGERFAAHAFRPGGPLAR